MSKHAATPSITATLRHPRRAPRHRAEPVRVAPRHARRPRRSAARALLATLPILAAAILTVLALSIPQQSATALVRTDVVQPAVRLQWVPAEVLPAEPTAPVVEEDGPAFDCKTMGNRSCPEVRTTAEFPGVNFHYVVTYAADGSVAATYTQRSWERMQGLALTQSTATDRY